MKRCRIALTLYRKTRHNAQEKRGSGLAKETDKTLITLEMFDAFIFDMDGVIVDSEPLHMKAERQTLAPYGIVLSPQELQSYMGRSTRFLLENIIQHYDLDTTVGKLYPDHMKNLLRLYREEVELMPGVLALIDDLTKHDVTLALASSSDNDLISSVIDKFHIASSFTVVVSGEDVRRTKPYPDIFLEAVRRLDYYPCECVVIEDSNAGVRASKNAGIPCVGFRSPNSKNQDLSEASLIIDTLQAIDTQRLKHLVDNVV